VAYPELLAHMREAKLDPAVNIWNDVHDFSPGGGHFELVSGTKLELEIGKFESELSLIFTHAISGGPHFAVLVKDEKLAELARFSLREDVRIERTTRADSGAIRCVVPGESVDAVRGLFAELAPVEVSNDAT
jgi:hypothetical protein